MVFGFSDSRERKTLESALPLLATLHIFGALHTEQQICPGGGKAIVGKQNRTETASKRGFPDPIASTHTKVRFAFTGH